jgi:hypothetical protein
MDSTLYSLPGEVIVIHLEHLNTPPDSIKPGTDTDGIGVDIVSFKITDTVNISFKIDTIDYIIEMYNKKSGQKVLLLNEDIRHRIRRYDPGDYLIHITSLLNYNDDTLNYQLIFIQPDISSMKSTNDNEVFWFIQSRVRECEECMLRYFDFSGFDLSHVNLKNSDLLQSKFIGATMPATNLSGADLTQANFTNAYLHSSNLFNAMMQSAMLDHANIVKTDLQWVDFTNASLMFSNAVGANFCNAIKDGWNIAGMQTDSTTLCFP